MEKGTKVIITGAGGHIGTNLWSFLLSRGFVVHGTGIKKNIKGNYHNVDISDEEGH